MMADCSTGAGSFIPLAGSHPPAIDQDVLWPRDDAHRYRLYALDEDGQHVVRAAASSHAGVGVAICQLAADRREDGLDPEVMAVYDSIDRYWLTTLWAKRGI